MKLEKITVKNKNSGEISSFFIMEGKQKIIKEVLLSFRI
jgi:hypothetical protein